MENQSFSLEEKMIPVLTVMKNNAVLKNIFLLSNSSAGGEETVVVGRHPDCDVSLSHPSISRFHLRILSNPSACSLSVIDLSSVHGTWVMGKKIKPNLRVELNQGDTMQIGRSSRVYRLLWVPLSRVYDIENPFVSPSYVCEPVEEDKDQEGTLEDENGLSCENSRVQLLDDDNSEGSDCEVSDEKSKLSLNNEIPSVQPFSQEDVENKSIADKELKSGITSNSFSGLLETESETETSSWFDEILSETEIQQLVKDQKGSQKLQDTESEQNLDFLESLASLYPKEYSENQGSAKFNLFSEKNIRQLDNESQSQKENMGTPPENNCTSITDQEKKMGPSIFSEKPVTEPEISSFYDEFTSKNQNQQFKEEKGTPLENNSTSITDQEKKMGPSIFSEELVTEFEISSFSDEITLKNPNQQFKEEQTSTKVLVPIELEQNADSLESLPSLFSHELSGHSYLPDIKLLPEVEIQQVKKENESQEENVDTPLVTVDKQFSSSNNCPRRCKPSSVLTIQTGRSSEMSKMLDLKLYNDLSNPGDNENNEVTRSPFIGLDAAEEAFTPDKKNYIPNTLALDLVRNNSCSMESKEEISKNLFPGLNENKEQFTPDKENMTPNTLLMRSMVRMSRMKETNGSSLYVSSSLKHILCPSVEGKPSPKLLHEWKLTRSSSGSRKVMKRKSGAKCSLRRVPFQTLFENSSSMSKSEASALSSTTKSCNTMKHAEHTELKGNVKEDKRKWHMVVDTNCLLKESRKVLQLLQGLKGTQMIIPRIVIRELDRMNRQGSLFRRMEASCALQWIEECMKNTDWWIHVESSEEEESGPIAPTSPAIPESRFSDVYHRFSGGAASSVFTAWWSLLEIVSPKAQDHVLECALQFKGHKSDGKFVLLSNDVALKIKAMAEGLICETAQEFRDSLVNPFSDRFLWRESSPRGLTWSCKDDMVLKEKFYKHAMKLGGGEGAKGLKVILPHNACYAHTSLVS